MNLRRIAAFSDGNTGGNPAGVWIGETLPGEVDMQRIAAEVGFSETAFAGYLRDLGWPHGGVIDLVQGEDMGMRSRLRAEIPPGTGSSIRVSGTARTVHTD